MILLKKTTQRTPLFLILVGLIFFFCLQGCKNPFKTRKSPPPAIEERGTWVTPSDPKDVVQNLLYAYNEKHIENFDRCLCDSFRFSAPEDSIKAVQDNREELFANWDKSTEFRVTFDIFSLFGKSVDSIRYELSFDSLPPVPDQVEDTMAILSRDYELSIVKSDPPETTLAKGTATFYMIETSLNPWSIYFWSDIPDVSGGYDWGDFKAGFK